MPLLDHFHPPLSRRRHWESLHSAWANSLRDQLNEVLPPQYFAEVQIRLGKEVEIDVATLTESQEGTGDAGGVAVWSPPQPTRTVLLPATPADVFEVQVLTDEEGPRLVAAIELVSPSNKDRPANRRAFASKCGSYVHHGIGLIVVDVVTNRSSSLHAPLLEFLEIAPEPSAQPAPSLFAGAYRGLPTAEGLALSYWWEALAVGEPLPTLPLWISPDQSLPVHLEQAYQAACASSRIP